MPGVARFIWDGYRRGSRGYYALRPIPAEVMVRETVHPCECERLWGRRPARHSRRSKMRPSPSIRSILRGGYRLELWRLYDNVDRHAKNRTVSAARWRVRAFPRLVTTVRTYDQWMIPFCSVRRFMMIPLFIGRVRPLSSLKKSRRPLWSSSANAMPNVPLPSPCRSILARVKNAWRSDTACSTSGEGHLYLKPENQVDRLDRTVAWFDKI